MEEEGPQASQPEVSPLSGWSGFGALGPKGPWIMEKKLGTTTILYSDIYRDILGIMEMETTTILYTNIS